MTNEEDVFTKEYKCALDVWEDIDYLEDNEPKDKRTKDWKDWYSKLDYLSHLYNTKVGFFALKNSISKKYKPLPTPKRGRKKKNYEVC
jgi:hypothetical protein